MNIDLTTKAKHIIATIHDGAIATVSKNGSPWNTPVFLAYDKDYNFYWSSHPEAQHSKNIKENKNVFIVIFNTRYTRDEGAKGVYIQAKAHEINDEQEVTEALNVFYGRKGKAPQPTIDFLGKNPRRLYKAIVKKIWINTYEKINGYAVDKRVEINLKNEGPG